MTGSQPISSLDEATHGPHYRDSAMMASGAPASSARIKPRLCTGEFLASKWAKLFFLVVTLQAIVCVAFES